MKKQEFDPIKIVWKHNRENMIRAMLGHLSEDAMYIAEKDITLRVSIVVKHICENMTDIKPSYAYDYAFKHLSSIYEIIVFCEIMNTFFIYQEEFGHTIDALLEEINDAIESIKSSQ